MNWTLAHLPMPILITPPEPMDDDALWEFCHSNDLYKIEQTREGDLRVMSPSGGGTSNVNAEIIGQLWAWTREDGRGVSFDSNGGFRLPDGSMLSPDGAWVERERWDWSEIGNNPFFCPDPVAAAGWAVTLEAIRKQGSSLGAIIEITVTGVKPGLGAPIYGKLDADIAAALMSINAVKGVEIGDGFAAAALQGEEDADEMRMENGEVKFLANHAGGILGGISTSQPIIARFAVKPTSSILKPVRSVDRSGAEIDIVTKGRHDPCVGIRAVPVGEAMLACVLADHLLRHRAQNGETEIRAKLPRK